jgi:hypothetical protein
LGLGLIQKRQCIHHNSNGENAMQPPTSTGATRQLQRRAHAPSQRHHAAFVEFLVAIVHL